MSDLKITLTESLEGRFYLSIAAGDNTFPTILYRDPKSVVARIAQILGVKEPVNPQDYPEKVIIEGSE